MNLISLMMSKYNVAQIHLCTECEGPFRRAAIWFQGCTLHCEGCCNPQLQPLVPKHIMTFEELLSVIETSRKLYHTEGVTFLGGEPTLQMNLSNLAAALQEQNIGVILFTGRIFSELSDELVSVCDMIIDGAFIASEIDTKRNLIGSLNQKIYHITDRYRNAEDWFYQKRNKIVRIDTDDQLIISGDVL